MKFILPKHSFVLAFFTIIFIFSCKKADIAQKEQPTPNLVEEKFFNSHRTTNPTETALVEFVKRKNDELHFVEKTVKQIGFPRWDKAITKKNSLLNGRSSDSSTITYVPFVRDSQKYVNASMIIKISRSDTSFKYVCDWQYSRFHNSTTALGDKAEHIAMFFMVLDKHVFGYNKFKIIDTSLFKTKKYSPDYLTLDNPKKGGRISVQEVEMCQDVSFRYLDCPYYNSDRTDKCTPTCDKCGLCYSVSFYQYCWTEYIYDSGSGGNTGGSTSGGGATSSGGDGTPPNCVPPGARTSVQQRCEPGWEPDPNAVYIAGQWYSPNNYPGINNGFSWKWWEDDILLQPFGGRQFGTWAINYLAHNPHITFNVFQNQFLATYEGVDGVSDASFWDDPNNTYTPQSVPSWAAFNAAFPKRSDPLYDTPQKLYSSIGGDVYANGYTGPLSNTCAVRVSKALNYSGVTIPNISGKTFLGNDGKYYFLGAENLNRWMRKTFGCGNPNTAIGEYLNTDCLYFSPTDIGPYGSKMPYYLQGLNGIYSMVSNDPNWATGHTDLLTSSATCDGGCHFNGPVRYIDVWILK